MAYALDEIYADVAQVQHQTADCFGSGRLIGRNLILTARHVLHAADDSPIIKDSWQIRLLAWRKTGETWVWRNATLAWDGGSGLDVALLKVQSEPGMPDLVPVLRTRIGLIETTKYYHTLGCGFPRGARIDQKRALFVPTGQLVDEQNPTLSFCIDQAYQPEVPDEDWRGFSGATILLRDSHTQGDIWIFGVAQQVDHFFSRRLAVARMSDAWDDVEFCQHLINADVQFTPPTDPLTPRLKSAKTEKGIRKARTILHNRVFNDFVDGPLSQRLIGGRFLDIPFKKRPDLEHMSLISSGDEASTRKSTSAGNDLKGVLSSLNDEQVRHVLIMGEPGAGKSMLLLECARQALKAIQGNYDEPLPAVVWLSSWTANEVKSPSDESYSNCFRDWLSEQFSILYKTKSSFVGHWLDEGDLDLYLDGLDEVPELVRNFCARCISAFQDSYSGRVFMTCRKAEYEDLEHRVRPDVAIEVLPMTREQVIRIIDSQAMTILGQAFEATPALLELGRSPLMLSVMTFVYAEDEGSVAREVTPTVNGLFAAFVDKAFDQRAKSEARYKSISRKVTMHALKQLARHNSEVYNPVFFLSDISASWFHQRWQSVVVYGMFILISCLLAAKTAIFSFHVSDGSWLATGWTAFIVLLFSVSFFMNIDAVPIYEHVHLSLKRSIKGVGIGILVAAVLAIWQIVALIVASLLLVAVFVLLMKGLLVWVLGLLIFGGITLWVFTENGKLVVQSIIPFFLFPILLLLLVSWITTGDFSVASLVEFATARSGGFESSTPIWTIAKIGLVTIWTCFLFVIVISITAGALIGAVTLKTSEHLKQSKHSMKRLFLIAVALALVSALVGVLIFALLELIAGRTGDFAHLWYVGVALAILVFGVCGGVRSIAYYFVRVLLALGGSIPLRYSRVLDVAVDVGILVRVGAGYAFIHKLEQEYFSQLLDKQIS